LFRVQSCYRFGEVAAPVCPAQKPSVFVSTRAAAAGHPSMQPRLLRFWSLLVGELGAVAISRGAL